MALTTAQLQIIKADIESKAAFEFEGSPFSILLASTQLDKIARYYNTVASPAVDIWKPDLTVEEITNQIVMADFISITQARRDAWFAMSQASTIDATISLVRTNFQNIFGAGTTTLTNVTAIAKKEATNLEALFTSGGVSSLYKYSITPEDILSALRL